MTRECSGCGLRSCDGRCFDECPSDYEDNNLTQLRTGTLGLTESRSDPFAKQRKAA